MKRVLVIEDETWNNLPDNLRQTMENISDSPGNLLASFEARIVQEHFESFKNRKTKGLTVYRRESTGLKNPSSGEVASVFMGQDVTVLIVEKEN